MLTTSSDKQSSLCREFRRMYEANSSMQLNQSTRLDEISQKLREIESNLRPARTGTSPLFESEAAFYGRLSDALSKIVLSAKGLSTQRRVLRSLYFRALPVRHQSIAEAHKSTFRWIVDEDNKNNSQRNFLQWLKAGDGVFWVSGKPGSGKSTLMKFLASHAMTFNTVSSWAAPNSCVIAQYYFWSAGTHLQKSLEGLIRSLLFEILRRKPELMPIILLERWDAASGAEIQDFDERDGSFWSMPELFRAADRLGDWKETSTRFCFFIDGLDEFSGDHNDIVKILDRLSSSPNLKICVASRPWNIFEDAYGQKKENKFYLQDLTRGDIQIYVESMLEAHPNWNMIVSDDTRCSALAQKITRKSQGVFLWVHLVLKSLYEGLTNGDDLYTLRQRIRRFPEDLESFFKVMLKSIDPFYYPSTARFFKVALEAREPLTLMCFLFVDKAVRDVNFGLHRAISPMDDYEIFNNHSQMRRRVDGRCKGLLEVEKVPYATDYLGHRVNFLHRTVRDFLLTRDMTEFIEKHLKEFNVNHAIFQAFVALMKSMPVRDKVANTELELTTLFDESLHYAWKAEQETGQADPDLVDEARDTFEMLLSSMGRKPSWDYFRKLAITRGLWKYLDQRRDCQSGSQAIIDGSLLRYSLTESVRQHGVDDPDLTEIVAMFVQRVSATSQFDKRNVKYWLSSLNKTIPKAGMDHIWAARQQHIMELLLSQSDQVDVGGAAGDFVSGLFDLALEHPKRQAWEIWIEMLVALLRAGVDPNAAYKNSTVAENFFRSLLNFRRTGQWIKVPMESLEFLARITEILLVHRANAACMPESTVSSLFPGRLGSPLKAILEAGNQPASQLSVLFSWLPWPFRRS